MNNNHVSMLRNENTLQKLSLVSLSLVVMTLGLLFLATFGASWIFDSLVWNILFPLLFLLPIPAFFISVIVFFMKNTIGSRRKNLANTNLLLSTILFIVDVILWSYASSWSV